MLCIEVFAFEALESNVKFSENFSQFFERNGEGGGQGFDKGEVVVSRGYGKRRERLCADFAASNS